MRLLFFCLICFTGLFSCKEKKVILTGEEPVEIKDFVNYFPEVKLSYVLVDSLVVKKKMDSLPIAEKIFQQFIPDTVFKKELGKTKNLKWFALGRAEEKEKETYLFVKGISGTRQVVYVLVFDADKQYKASKMLLQLPAMPGRNLQVSMDRRYTITLMSSRKGKEGQNFYNRQAYVYNTAGTFTLIMTENNEPVEEREVYNPLDTLPRKHKYSGDYISNSRNFVTIRDGRTDKEVQFFIHFEKNNSECIGEIRGKAIFIKPDVAIFRETGDPCVLELKFSAKSISLREEAGCGNYRGIKCFFEGSYPRKKEPAKPKQRKK